MTFFPVPIGTLDLRVDHRVLLFTALLAIVGGLLASVVPILRAGHAGLPGRAASRASSQRSKLVGGLVIIQIALSSVLLVGTGLLLRSLQSAYAVDPGYRLDNVLFLSVDLQSMGPRYDETRTQ